MNCPSHVLIFKQRARSYRNLPWRVADFAPLHRNELKGVLSGLTRVRKFSQDDSHIFCTHEQVGKEMDDLLAFVDYVYKDVFGLEYSALLSTRPEDFMGEIKLWDDAEKDLENALKKKKIKYEINHGDGAFYGPKIDFEIKDSLGRRWQLATLQLDFQMPLRFKAEYTGEDGKKHTPVMIHRAILGSIERFMAVMVEHFAGKFPLWLSPVQAAVLTIADRHADYAHKVAEKLRVEGLRVEVHDEAESIPKKVRNAQLAQINYILVVGDNEVKNKTVTVRTRDNKVHGEKKVAELVKQLKEEVGCKKL